MISILGRYRHGNIELFERPEGIDEAEVIVTFLHAGRDDDAERLEALNRLIEIMSKGHDLGGAPYPTRDEIYAERLDRYK